ncbi:MAG: hypothetical protein KatS3mg105_4890 [Gemmatales bacterium]|nr:MAG: hypothetical protein KatS3mg105_4890 [Gemmatales bacterium]
MKTQLLSGVQIARRLGIGPKTLYRWSQSGVFPPPLRLGRRGRVLRWTVEEVEAFLQGCRQEKPADHSGGQRSRHRAGAKG